MEKISEIIRQAVIDSGQSHYAIWQATGVDQAILSRWIAGERGVNAATLDKLADYLGLTLVKKRGQRVK